MPYLCRLPEEEFHEYFLIFGGGMHKFPQDKLSKFCQFSQVLIIRPQPQVSPDSLENCEYCGLEQHTWQLAVLSNPEV